MVPCARCAPALRVRRKRNNGRWWPGVRAREPCPPAARRPQAREQGMEPDAYYCMAVLKNTGIVIVPGSGFKQVSTVDPAVADPRRALRCLRRPTADDWRRQACFPGRGLLSWLSSPYIPRPALANGRRRQAPSTSAPRSCRPRPRWRVSCRASPPTTRSSWQASEQIAPARPLLVRAMGERHEPRARLSAPRACHTGGAQGRQGRTLILGFGSLRRVLVQ